MVAKRKKGQGAPHFVSKGMRAIKGAIPTKRNGGMPKPLRSVAKGMRG